MSDLDDLASIGEIDAVLLDVGGVFLVPSPVLIGGLLADRGIEAPEDDETYVRAHYQGVRALDGLFDDGAGSGWPGYHEAYAAALGHDGHAEVHALLTDAWARPSMDVWTHAIVDNVAALARLGEEEVPRAVVSNSDGRIEEILAGRNICQVGPGEGTEVALVVDSHVVGVAKPQPGIFEPALAAVGVDPARVAHVGDSAHYDVGGAVAAGLVPIQIDPFDGRPDATHLRISSLHVLVDRLTTR